MRKEEIIKAIAGCCISDDVANEVAEKIIQLYLKDKCILENYLIKIIKDCEEEIKTDPLSKEWTWVISKKILAESLLNQFI
jgi:hypothetical protein